jgi:hypothetical protein
MTEQGKELTQEQILKFVLSVKGMKEAGLINKIPKVMYDLTTKEGQEFYAKMFKEMPNLSIIWLDKDKMAFFFKRLEDVEFEKFYREKGGSLYIVYTDECPVESKKLALLQKAYAEIERAYEDYLKVKEAK